MLTAYRTNDNTLEEVPWNYPLKGLWLKLVNPSPEEVMRIAATTQIPENFFRFAVDEDDSPRIIIGKNCILAIIHVPIRLGNDRFETSPLSIILTPELTVTISEEGIEVLPDNTTNPRFTFDTTKITQFFFQLLYQSDAVFLKSIRFIQKRTDELELRIRKSTNNQEVFQLLDLEKGLTYFTAALHGNVIVAQTILRMRADPQMNFLLEMRQEDENVLESVIIENKRALELTQTYSDILSSMMNAFSSVITNNLNLIMKFLASVTILLAVPTMIFTFWGMTIPLPFQYSSLGFLIVLSLALITTAGVGYVLLRKGLL